MSEVDCPTTVPPGERTVTEDGLGQKEREIHNQEFPHVVSLSSIVLGI